MAKLDRAFQIENFLNEKEVVFIETIGEKIPKQTPESGFDAHTNGFDYKLIKKIIDEKLKRIFGNFNVKDCMILEETNPWDIHTDFDKGDNDPYYACLIPLNFENKITHTVIFNEQAKNKEDISNLPVAQIPLDDDILSTLEHCDADKLQKVSLFAKFKWQRGFLIAWDRLLLHTSDNFIKNGMTCKKALVLFLNKDEDLHNG